MKLSLALISLVFFLSCSRKEPRIVYDSPEGAEVPQVQQEEQLKVSLPIAFENLPYVYFPIGSYEADRSKLHIGSGSYSKGSTSYVYQGEWSIEGNLDNLMVRDRKEGAISPLTTQKVKISHIRYLIRMDTLHQKSLLLFEVVDEDSNRDGYLNYEDMKSLYLSGTDGSNFRRISPPKQHLLDWDVWAPEGLLFFRVHEDLNKDGIFDKQDRVHLYEYNFLNDKPAQLILNEQVYSELH